MTKILKKYTLLLLLFIPSLTGYADEGMWLLNLMAQTQYEDMKTQGLQLTAEEIYSEQKPSLKDAVVALDYGSCTGSMVSSSGLMITNHHCAYDDIRKQSTLQHDYLKNGFWARSSDEELVVPGKTVMFLDRIIDVTQEYRAILDTMTNPMWKNGYRPSSSRKVNFMIEKKYARKGYETACVSMLRGESYLLFYYKIYKDVRLVAAPPSCFGTFGGDTDNWSWPQHKGDFALYRVYGGKDGEPAAYSPDNTPIRPKKVLKISIAGLQEGDYTMVLGYPGSTTRYTPSWGIKEKTECRNPALIEVREAKLNILREAMNADPQTKLQYASEYFNSSNYWKYAVGENQYLKRYKVFARRQQEETELARWIAATPERQATYGNLLENLKKTYAARASYAASGAYYTETFLNGPALRNLFFRFYGTLKGMEIKKKEQLSPDDKDVTDLLKDGEEFFQDFNKILDCRLFASMIRLYAERVDRQYIPEEIKKMIAEFGGNYEKLADFVYEHSVMTDFQRLKSFLARGLNAREALQDPAYLIFCTSLDLDFESRQALTENDRWTSSYKALYTHALVAMHQEKGQPVYPDANSTMRITYGTVGGYSPKDGVEYHCHSTLKGYLEKYKPGDPEFDLTPACLNAVRNAVPGRYADSQGNLPTAFLCNLDITGGNSGSPVLNSQGELVGLAYDGNWESMAGAFYYHPEYNKCVCVDIRFILWILDEYAHADKLLQELQIIG